MSIKTGAKLADLRKRHGYSQEALAEKLGYHYSHTYTAVEIRGY